VLTDILLSLGCVDAINLDGGGSSCIFSGDSLVNQPSDGSTRAIPTAVTILRSTLLSVTEKAEFNRFAEPADSLTHEHFPWGKSYLFDEGTAGHFLLKPGKPGGYRVEYALTGSEGDAYADSAMLVLHRTGGLMDSILLRPGTVETNSLFLLGEYQLGTSDTLTVINLDPGHPLPVAGIRFTRTGSGLPGVDLIPAVYSGIHAYNEQLQLTVEAESINPARKISRMAVYEQSGGNPVQLKDTLFDPVSSFSDSILYTVLKKEGTISIVFAIFDQVGDSVTVSYTIDIDDSPPTVSLGKNSNLQGDVGDTLVFELQVRPAHEGRLLDLLTISRNPASENLELDRFTPTPSGDTIEYKYVLKKDDAPGIVFRFEVTDEAGYSSYRDYSHLVNHLPAGSKPLFTLHAAWLSGRLEIISGDKIPSPVTFSVYTLTGKKIYTSTEGPGSRWSLSLTNLPAGIYLLHAETGSQTATLKFLKASTRNALKLP
jgi:hypothetical protein